MESTPNNPYYSIGIKKYIEMQKLEIEEHKWYLSERRGYEISYNEATLDFIQSGYAKLFRDNFVAHIKLIEDCNDCGLLEEILLDHDTKKLHKLLGDK